MSLFGGLFDNTRFEVDAQRLVEARWENARLMLNGDNVTKQQEVMFKLMLTEVVRDQLANQNTLQRLSRMISLLWVGIVAVGIETLAVRFLLPPEIPASIVGLPWPF